MKTVYRSEYLIRPRELARVENERAAGIRSAEVVQLFASKGAKLSPATFRKYVQLGLLPRSRRVGRKGKHKGSTGLYPVSVVRRIDLIKRMMREGMTIEEIRGSFVAVKNQLDDVEQHFSALLDQLSRRVQAHPLRRKMVTELGRAEREVRAALRRVERVGGTVATVPGAEPEQWAAWRRTAGVGPTVKGGQPAAT